LNLQEKVDNVTLIGYTTCTAHALNKSVHDFKLSNRFNRTGNSKVLILVTDGKYA